MSREDIERSLPEVLSTLIESSVEFADVLRRFFKTFVIQPVQALDTGQVRPRAVLSFEVGVESDEPEQSARTEEVVLNVFNPPDHIDAVPQVRKLRSKIPRPTYREIGKETGIHLMTIKRAAKYIKLMIEAGTTDPYVVLTEKPGSASRWRQAS
jgi:hypothetical protein